MPHPPDRSLLRPVGQGLAVAGLLASGLMAARRLRGGAGPAVTEASTFVPHLTPP